MNRGVIFDLDGVLISTDHFHYLSWKKIADDEGICFDEKINNLIRGVSREESLDIILKKSLRIYTEDEKKNLCEKKNEIYKEYLKNLTSGDVKKEVFTTLIELKKRGYLLGIGSVSKNATIILKKTNLINYIDVVVDGNMISHSKPDPEIFLKVASFLKINPKDSYVVEDASSGIESAINGCFHTIGMPPANQYSKTEHKIEKIEEILNFL